MTPTRTSRSRATPADSTLAAQGLREQLGREPLERRKLIMKIDIGIGEEDRKRLSEELSKMLADSYTLYLKTHNFHWNVTGPMFQTLHLMFEQQYNELWLAVDLIAERIRALGFPAPGTYRQFVALSSIKEDDGVPKAEDMIRRLVEGHETVARTARKAFELAETTHDQPTCDLLTQRMQVHEKTAWMLRSLLE
jgi:starvation-inducible DNA-binding protein